jgi:8-oxo-dGTP pyrophosphatase MutT (NUDIX family)
MSSWRSNEKSDTKRTTFSWFRRPSPVYIPPRTEDRYEDKYQVNIQTSDDDEPNETNNEMMNRFNRVENNDGKKKITTSYGIIVFSTDGNTIQYLLSQRRDSISYAEFLKDNQGDEEIKKYVPLMTFEEKRRCVEAYTKNKSEELWDDLWVNHRSRIYRQDKKRCCEAFMKKLKIYLPLFEDPYLGMEENQWGFPKGRKHASESDLLCALREFEEETTIQRESLEIISCKPFEELYTGTDGNPYRSVFFVAHIDKIPRIRYRTNHSMFQRQFVTDETSRLEWHTYHETLPKVDSSKKDLLARVHQFLLFTRKKHKRREKNVRRMSQ